MVPSVFFEFKDPSADVQSDSKTISPLAKPAMKLSERNLFPELRYSCGSESELGFYKHERDIKIKTSNRGKTIQNLFLHVPLTVARGVKASNSQKCIISHPESSSSIEGVVGFSGLSLGNKQTQEDGVRFCSIEVNSFSGQTRRFPFFGVYDGHGGVETRDFLVLNLHTIVAEKLGKIDVKDPLQVKLALKAAFIEVDGKYGKQEKEQKSGATALAGCIVDETLWLANTGDCRAVLVKGSEEGFSPIQLTQDAVATDEPFLSSLQKRGYNGKFIYNTYDESKGAQVADRDPRLMGYEGVVVPRVYLTYEQTQELKVRSRWPLMPARVIGDSRLPGVSPRPKVKAFDLSTLDSTKDSFLVMATDGLWDVMSSLDVGRAVGEAAACCLCDDQKIQQITFRLLNEAHSMGANDNTTVMIIKL